MPLPFATWTIEDARKAAALSATLKPLIEAAQKFYEGDHWQNGAGWIGPRPQQGEAGEMEALAIIAGVFTSRNAVKEVVDRHARGVIGQEPEWGLTPRRAMAEDDEPTPEETAEIDMLEASLTAWWDKKKVHNYLKKAVASLLQAQRAAIRFYIPKARLKPGTREVVAADGSKSTATDTQVQVSGLDGALENLFIEHPLPANAAVYTDPQSQAQVGIVIYKPDATPLNEGKGEEVAELVWVDENGKTVMRTVGGSASSALFEFDFAGLMTIHEMLRPPLVTEQILQSQKGLNLAETVIGRNVVTGGFLERIFLNAQMPGTWVDESGEPAQDAASRKRFIPAKYKTGAGTTQFVRGFDYEDPKDGSLKVTDPQVVFREASPVTAPIEAKKSFYADILEEADQAHVLLASEPVLSGKSRTQARTEYVSSLQDSKDVADALGRWLIELALAEAEALSGKPGVFIAKYRATFSCRLNAGPLDAADRAADETSVEKGTMADETAMIRNGILDVDAEKARINASDRGQLDTSKRQGEAMGLWTTAGLSLEGAARIVIGKEDPVLVIKEESASGGFSGDPNADPNANPNAPPGNNPPAPGNAPPGNAPPANTPPGQ